MNAQIVLLSHSLKRSRLLVLSMAGLLIVFQILFVLHGGYMHRTGNFDQLGAMLPPFIRELIGPSFTTFMTFGGMVCLGYFHPVVMISLVALSITLGTIPASEVETGFIDLILSRPIRRGWIISRSVIVCVVYVSFVLIAMIGGTWMGLHAFAPTNVTWPSWKMIRAIAVNLGFLLFAWSAIALAIASVSRRRGVAGGIAGFTALAAYLVDYIGRAWTAVETVARFSPFHYYLPFDLIMGKPLPVQNLAILMGIAVAGIAFACVMFSRRDISR